MRIAGLIPRAFPDRIVFTAEAMPGQTAFAIVRKGFALSAGGLAVVRTAECREQSPARRHARCATRRAPQRCFARVYEIFPKLKERRSQRAGTMSGGERQMLAVGRALMSNPRLLMLDEPSLGLGTGGCGVDVRDVWPPAPEGLTILLAEQSIELALEVSDFATVLQVGKSVPVRQPRAALAQDPQVQKAYLGTG